MTQRDWNRLLVGSPRPYQNRGVPLPGTKRGLWISKPTVDRTNYAYCLQCYISAYGLGDGIIGADVTYTITAANG